MKYMKQIGGSKVKLSPLALLVFLSDVSFVSLVIFWIETLLVETSLSTLWKCRQVRHCIAIHLDHKVPLF